MLDSRHLEMDELQLGPHATFSVRAGDAAASTSSAPQSSSRQSDLELRPSKPPTSTNGRQQAHVVFTSALFLVAGGSDVTLHVEVSRNVRSAACALYVVFQRRVLASAQLSDRNAASIR